jgi:modification methylase
MSTTTKHKIITGDARNMEELSDESVHLVVTSPPYWQLKDYGSDDQIGFNDTYENYINQMNLVWAECHRVLHKGCRLCINIGEQFARSVYYGRYKIISIHTEIIKFCEIIGFDYMGAIIWQKATSMNTTGGASIMGSFPNPRNGILKLDYEFILLFKKQGDAPKPNKTEKDLSAMTTEEWNTFFNGHWNFAGAKQNNGHIAMFPEELPRRLIKMFAFVGDTVLDPFMGSGTTAVAAKNLNRNSIGYEINPDFIPIIKQKLKVDEPTFFGETQYEFVVQPNSTKDFIADIKKLPYQFIDTHHLDKKVDVKKMQFGSKIDDESQEREEYFTVKKIFNAEKLELSNGSIVKLIGIKEDTNNSNHAIDFIYQKTKGQKVFLKYDQQKQDKDANLLVYLYLQNKTFINAHLVKERLVLVDNEMDFKYKKRFNDYINGKKED